MGYLAENQLERSPDGRPLFQGPGYEVYWARSRLRLQYAGVMEVEEPKLGSARRLSPEALAFHPDGRIAVSDGRGATKRMFMRFWENDKLGDPVVDIRFMPVGRRSQDRWVEKGRLNFFNGPLAFDLSGKCYFSLGNVYPNGIFKVPSCAQPRIRKLYTITLEDRGTPLMPFTLQVPRFGEDQLYVTPPQGIVAYPLPTPRMVSGAMGRPRAWLEVKCNAFAITLGHSPILSRDRVLAEVAFPLQTRDGKGGFRRTLVLNKRSRTFHLLPWERSGPMAISFDGKRMIRYDEKSKAIKEFRLGDALKSTKR